MTGSDKLELIGVLEHKSSMLKKKDFLINSGLKKVRWQYCELFGMLCTTWLLSKGEVSRGIQYVLFEFIFLKKKIFCNL